MTPQEFLKLLETVMINNPKAWILTKGGEKLDLFEVAWFIDNETDTHRLTTHLGDITVFEEWEDYDSNSDLLDDEHPGVWSTQTGDEESQENLAELSAEEDEDTDLNLRTGGVVFKFDSTRIDGNPPQHFEFYCTETEENSHSYRWDYEGVEVEV